VRSVKSIRNGKLWTLFIAVLLVALQCLCMPAFAQNAGQTLSPDAKMNRRFPQPVRVGDLIGLPVLDDDDSTIGYVHDVVRTPAGKIQLVVPYSPWFGWVKAGGPFDWNRRPVAVPLETVAILARQLDALDMPREAFDAAPTFRADQATSIGRDEIIKIALGRR
jgi:PRC-barrel domain